MSVHPTAIVHPDAHIADDVQIGPYVCIDAGVEIGAGCVIQSHAVLTGRLRLGERNRIGYGAIIGAEPQDLSFDPEADSAVLIGNDNIIREHSTIHRGTKPGSSTVVGDSNFLMCGAHLGHNAQVGNHVIIANNCLLAGHVEIGDGAFLGGGSVFHQFMRVGRLAMVRGGCRFSKDIPPFLIGTGENQVAGINSIGLRRSGLPVEARQEIRAAYKLLYRSGLNTSQALAAASEQTWGKETAAFWEFVGQAKRRGICDLRSRTADDEE